MISEEAIRRNEQFDKLHGGWTSLDKDGHSVQEPLSEQTVLRELGNVEVSLLRDKGNGKRVSGSLKQYEDPASSVCYGRMQTEWRDNTG